MTNQYVRALVNLQLARDLVTLRRSNRTFLRGGFRFYIWCSEHPCEERIFELTDDYRDTNGEFIIPELVAWDGVSST